MRYAIMRLAKIKSAKDMGSRYKHNTRIYDVYNADIGRAHLNEELISLNGQTYEDVYKETIARHKMEGSLQKTIRKDAVQGLEVMLNYTDRPEDTPIDLEAWKEKSLAWLQETFNPPGNTYTYTDKDGNLQTGETDNVRSVILHMDEATPHIHAFIMPMDDKGHLNSGYYISGREKMIRLQDEYAKAVESLGLSRGVPGSNVSHKEISKYHNELLRPLRAELPPVLPDETALEYKARADEVYQNALIHAKDREKQFQQQLLESARDANERERVFTKAEMQLKKKLHLPSLEERELEPFLSRAIQGEAMETAIAEYPDREVAEQAKALNAQLLSWQLGREKKERKKKDRSKRRTEEK